MSKVSMGMVRFLNFFLYYDHPIIGLIEVNCCDFFIALIKIVNVDFFSKEETIIYLNFFYCLTDYFVLFVKDFRKEVKLIIIGRM